MVLIFYSVSVCVLLCILILYGIAISIEPFSTLMLCVFISILAFAVILFVYCTYKLYIIYTTHRNRVYIANEIQSHYNDYIDLVYSCDETRILSDVSYFPYAYTYEV